MQKYIEDIYIYVYKTGDKICKLNDRNLIEDSRVSEILN